MLTDHQPPLSDEGGHTFLRQRPGWRVLAIVGIAVVLLAVIAGGVWGIARQQGSGTKAQTTPMTTATATVAPHVVYQADWSHGADGWNLPAGATIVGGHLMIDSGDNLSIEIPYVPRTPNYTVRMEFQIVLASIGGHFGLTARNAAGDRQYLAQMECTPMHEGGWNPSLGGCAGAVTVYAKGGTYPSGLFTSDYVVRGGPQSFDLEARGDTLTFCPTDDCLVPVTSGTPMDAGPHLIIEVRAVKLLVTAVTVTALS